MIFPDLFKMGSLPGRGHELQHEIIKGFIGLGVCLLVLLPGDRHQTQLSDDAKRRSSGFGREPGVDVLETNGSAGHFAYF